jgi:peptide deformylase
MKVQEVQLSRRMKKKNQMKTGFTSFTTTGKESERQTEMFHPHTAHSSTQGTWKSHGCLSLANLYESLSIHFHVTLV